MKPTQEFWLPYSRIPRDLWLSPDVKQLGTIKVFCAIAGRTKQGNTASIGQQLLADTLEMDRRSVRRALQQLERMGYLKRPKSGKGKRDCYEITSSVFGSKQRDGVREIAFGPSGGKRLVSRTA
jgi:hypothetical protein